MSITVTAERVGTYAVKYAWTGTAPFDIWCNGEKILNQTTTTSTVVQFPSETVPHAIEVRDADSVGVANSVKYSPRIRLQWRGQSGVDYYKVQAYLSAEWSTRQIVRENGKGYYMFTTIAQADASTVQWRIVPVDYRKYEGEPVTFSHYVVRNPEPPDVALSYAAGTGLLTVAAG